MGFVAVAFVVCMTASSVEASKLVVPNNHSYVAGKIGVNDFIINWTDNNNYSNMQNETYDQKNPSTGNVIQTEYSVRIGNETNSILDFGIYWHPSIKRPADATLDSYHGKVGGYLGRSDTTIQNKKALLLTYKEKKEYLGSESEPFINSAHYLARYFLDDHTEIEIIGYSSDWSAQDFKNMLNSLKITPPEGYY